MKKAGTYTDNEHIYSVDLMFMYVKTITSIKINVQKLLPALKTLDWGDIRPMDVIKNKTVSLNDYNRIIKADLRFPIIITSNYGILDGMHRLAKAYLNKNKYIRAYVIDNDTLKKMIISTKTRKSWSPKDWDYYESLSSKDIQKLFNERFRAY